MFVLLELCAKHVTCLWTQFFVGQIWGQSYQQKLVACDPILRLKCVRLVKRENWNVCEISQKRELKLVRLVQRENWNVWELFKERIEMCESSRKREIDSVHVTRNASKKMQPHLAKELPMKHSKNLTSTHVNHMDDIIQIRYICLWMICGIYNNFFLIPNFFCQKNMWFSSTNFTNFADVLIFFPPKSWFQKIKLNYLFLGSYMDKCINTHPQHKCFSIP